MDNDKIETYRLSLSPLRRGCYQQPTAAEIAVAQDVGYWPPVIVRRQPETPAGKRESFEILGGESTWFCAQALQRETVPVQILEIDEEAARRIAQMRIPTSGLDAISAVEETRRVRPTATLASVARAFGLSRSNLSHRYRLRKLDPSVKSLVVGGQLRIGAARALVTLRRQDQLHIARRAVEEKLSTRAVEQLAREARDGNEPPAQRSAPSAAPTEVRATDSVALAESQVAQRLSERLGCGVQLSGGRVVIDYYDNLEILQGILEQLGVGEGF